MALNSWDTLVSLASISHPAAFLKRMSIIWGVEVNSIAEIGVYEGRTSYVLRQLFPQATLYLIDPWEIYPEYLTSAAGPITQESKQMETAYLKVIKLFEQDAKVKILRQRSEEATFQVPELDLVYIDANHAYDYVKQDIQLWTPKVRPGGIISGHDYNELKFPEVVRAVDEIFGEQVIAGDNHSWAIYQRMP